MSIGVTVASAAGYLESTQARLLDLLIRLRGQHLASDVVIVAIDDLDFEALGQRQPLPRDYLARIVRGLERAGATVVGLDVALTAPTAADGALAAAIAGFGDQGLSRVVLVSTLPKGGPLADPRLTRETVRGAADMPEDPDGVIRRVAPLVPREGGSPEPALSVAIVARHAGLSQEALETSLAAGRLPGAAGPALTARPGELLRINFVGPAGTFLTVPGRVVAALADAPDAPAADNPFRGKVVLVGATFRDSRDFFQTPHGELPGVEVHANVVHMLLTGSLIRPSGWVLSLALQIAVVLGAGVALVVLRPFTATLVCVGAVLIVGLPASYLAFHRGGYWVDFLLPVLATRLLGSGAGTLERRRFREAFNRYVSPEVAAQVLKHAPSLAGERREVSILFSDLRGFTTLSETMAPEKIAALLTEYFEVMTAVIFGHRGMVNDFIGDAIMAIFGAPLDDPEHALHAARTAVAMDRALQALNERWKASDLPLLRMGIGIHTGLVFAGNVGGRSRVKYSIVGDPVNVASRVEGLNKELGTGILITEATRAALGDRAEARDCGAIPVKGRNEPVRVFELLAVHEAGIPRREGDMR